MNNKVNSSHFLVAQKKKNKKMAKNVDEILNEFLCGGYEQPRTKKRGKDTLTTTNAR